LDLLELGIETATSNLMHQINTANHKNETMTVIYIDLSRAFDTINLDKLLLTRVRDLTWASGVIF